MCLIDISAGALSSEKITAARPQTDIVIAISVDIGFVNKGQ